MNERLLSSYFIYLGDMHDYTTLGTYSPQTRNVWLRKILRLEPSWHRRRSTLQYILYFLQRTLLERVSEASLCDSLCPNAVLRYDKKKY